MKRIILLLVFAGLFLPHQKASAIERDSAIVVKVIKHGLTDTKNYLLSPTKWNKTNWLVFGGVSVATAALIARGDQPVYNFANTLHTPTLDILSLYSEPMGDIYPFLTMTGFMLAGLLSKDNYAVETGLIAAESYLFSGVACQLVKISAGRERPNNFNTTNPHQWDGPFLNGNSFFSGHTSSAFSVASVVAYRYRETVWVPILSYSLATLGGLQRIYQNRHWASDVLIGATVGTATGIFLSKQWEDNTLRFFPSVTTGGASISMVIPLK